MPQTVASTAASQPAAPQLPSYGEALQGQPCLQPVQIQQSLSPDSCDIQSSRPNLRRFRSNQEQYFLGDDFVQDLPARLRSNSASSMSSRSTTGSNRLNSSLNGNCATRTSTNKSNRGEKYEYQRGRSNSQTSAISSRSMSDDVYMPPVQTSLSNLSIQYGETPPLYHTVIGNNNQGLKMITKLPRVRDNSKIPSQFYRKAPRWTGAAFPSTPIVVYSRSKYLADGFASKLLLPITKERDVTLEDWGRFFHEIRSAGHYTAGEITIPVVLTMTVGVSALLFSGPMFRSMKKKKNANILQIVELWNRAFFLQRGMLVSLCRDTKSLNDIEGCDKSRSIDSTESLADSANRVSSVKKTTPVSSDGKNSSRMRFFRRLKIKNNDSPEEAERKRREKKLRKENQNCCYKLTIEGVPSSR
ncbi:hypothetical protein SJAG_04831 [Schizosaccharomyces japonicus yFS275]|uniref:Uncharacterized protein n=1 Tax=Schizosaccharomyces japonicus (strain yFS275 / FY16936) TaxID=402676 RepID=B6K7V8_SCHJY|nr:hypothetical protein SJAG_04831 [Schizosaccharomyces japonicus yFS275]EEB09612.1 hypothetical protein SJAG_04831 [Schizosaccharomyces japonicus yFS275]